MDKEKQTNLAKMTDKQKMLISQIGYLNISEEGMNKIQEEGLTIKELNNYLDKDTADKPYIGNFLNSKELEKQAGNENVVPEFLIDGGAGKGVISTERELVQELVNEGLGDLKLTDITSMNKGFDNVANGLQAIAFEDERGNKGISYGGSDFDIDIIGDWVISDVGEWLTNNSAQANDADRFFNKNKNENGNNYIYGHSLGGNLTAHTYVKNYNEIQEAFSINGTPLNTRELSKEQIEALNDPEKFSCCVVGEDIVSQVKDYSGYENNVKYIKNNKQNNAAFYSHTIQAATYDENGNFILENSKEKAYKGENIFFKFFRKTAKDVHGVIHNSTEFIKNIFEKGKQFIKSIGKEETKALPSGNVKDQVILNETVDSKKRNKYMDMYKVENWISDTYTREQAENAIKMSNNPEKYIKENNKSQSVGIQSKFQEPIGER